MALKKYCTILFLINRDLEVVAKNTIKINIALKYHKMSIKVS